MRSGRKAASRAPRKFCEEFKQEAVRLVTVREDSMAQATRDLSMQVNLLRTWLRTSISDAALAVALRRCPIGTGCGLQSVDHRGVALCRRLREFLFVAQNGEDGVDSHERFCNPIRRHSTLTRISPIAFEQAVAWRVSTEAGTAWFAEVRAAGVDSRVGEHGSLLTGGQRQRIGIALALHYERRALEDG
jgi:hypothetical protein